MKGPAGSLRRSKRSRSYCGFCVFLSFFLLTIFFSFFVTGAFLHSFVANGHLLEPGSIGIPANSGWILATLLRSPLFVFCFFVLHRRNPGWLCPPLAYRAYI